jgi:hypothetical protein
LIPPLLPQKLSNKTQGEHFISFGIGFAALLFTIYRYDPVVEVIFGYYYFQTMAIAMASRNLEFYCTYVLVSSS